MLGQRQPAVTSPTPTSHWRALEARRLMEDARALASIAESLRDGAAPPRIDLPTPAGAILIHAMTIDDAPPAPPAHGPTPTLVLLDDAPVAPEFLLADPGELASPTEEQARGLIARAIRGALDRAPSEHQLIDLVESIQDAVIVVDRQRKILYLNASATSLLQTLTLRTGPFVGQPLGTSFPPAASATIGPAIQAALLDADASRVSDPERHRGLALDVAIFPNPYGATLLVRDVTGRRELETRLSAIRVSLARAEALLRARDDEAPA